MIQPQPIWIASYPKSGNTWIRFILANLYGRASNHSLDIERFVQDVHKSRSIITRKDGPLFLKTHWMLTEKLPQREATKAAIYVVRNPLDVLASILSYLLVSQPRMVANSVNDFIQYGGVPSWTDEGYGSWEENVTSWALKDVEFPRLILRYEDLLNETFEQVSCIAKFLEIPTHPDLVGTAVARTSFTTLKQMEDRELAAGIDGLFMSEKRLRQRLAKTDVSKTRFMRKGGFGGFLERFTEDQNRRLLGRFSSIMKLVGYDPESFERIIKNHSV